MSPATCQLVNLFSPNANDSHSGRTTPSGVGGATSGRAFALTVDSNATEGISFNAQTDATICLIPCQG